MPDKFLAFKALRNDPSGMMSRFLMLRALNGGSSSSGGGDTGGGSDTPSYEKYSWEGVFASIDAGTYATDYVIGDCVPLDLGSEGLINMQIAAFDTDDLADGSGKAPITWVAKELLNTKHRMNPSLASNGDGTYQEGTGSIGGWEKSDMRAYLKNTIKPLIPDGVRNGIKEVTKVQPSYTTMGQEKYNATSTDDVWIPAYSEVAGSNSTYYGLFKDINENRIKMCQNTATMWWTRSASGSYRFRSFTHSGEFYATESPTSARGVCLCFCT